MKTKTISIAMATIICVAAITSNVIKSTPASADDKLIVIEESSSVSITELETQVEEPVYSAVVESEPIIEEIPEKPAKHSNWYSDEFMALNMAIKDYADQNIDFDFHGVSFDGLAVMAQANTESAYMMDPTKTLTALYPSRFVDIDSVEDISNLDVVAVWSNPDSLNGTYVDMPYWSYSAGPYYAWSSGDGVFEQGPLQQRGVSDSSVLAHSDSELSKLEAAGITSTVTENVYGYEAVTYCTGSDYLTYELGEDYYGDRWSVADNCKIWTATKKAILEDLWDDYYANCGYNPSKEEYLAILAYAHWIPEVIKGNASTEQAQFYGFSYDGAWFDISHQVASDEGLSIIRDYAIKAINENRSMYYDSFYTKEEAMAFTKMAIETGSTVSAEYSVPWQIFNDMVDAGIVDQNTIIEHPQYGYQHAMKYAIEYLYAYEMLELLLIEGY